MVFVREGLGCTFLFLRLCQHSPLVTRDSSGLWEHSEEELRRYVDATKTDTKARKRRLAEGWRPAEIRPVYLPTMAQLEDPKWCV